MQVNTDEIFGQHEDECNVLHENPQAQSSETTIKSSFNNSSELISAGLPIETKLYC